MPLMHSTRTTRTTTTTHPSLFHRMTHRTPRNTVTTRGAGHHHTSTVAPVHHQRRHATLGDKISGALLKLKGTVTGRPGVKVCSSFLSSLLPRIDYSPYITPPSLTRFPEHRLPPPPHSLPLERDSYDLFCIAAASHTHHRLCA